jgi:GH18 family chitinase
MRPLQRIYNTIIPLYAVLSTLLLLQGAAPAHAQQRKVVAYYPMWAQHAMTDRTIPPWEVDWRGITHVVHFHNGPTVTADVFPYFLPVASAEDSIRIQHWYTDCGTGCYPVNYQDSLILYAHRNGVKVLLDVQDVVPTTMNRIVEDSVKSQALVDASVAYARRKGYDGIEMDIESWATPPSPLWGYERLIRMYRRALDRMTPRGIFAISPSTAAWGHWNPNQNALVDMYLIQTYEFHYCWDINTSRHVNWHVSPLLRGASTPSNMNAHGWNSLGPPQWVAAGHEPSKIVPGIPTYGRILLGQDSLFKVWGGQQIYASNKAVRALLGNGGIERWDDERKVPYIGGTAETSDGTLTRGQKFFATFENPRSIGEKVRWSASQGYGGVMLYDLTMDLDHTQPFGRRNPLIAAAVAASGTSTWPTGTLTASPAQLPAGGGTVTLTWTSSNAASCSISGVGEVPPGGSRTVQVRSTTVFTLTMTGTTGATVGVDAEVEVGSMEWGGGFDITPNGTIISLVTAPRGSGSGSPEVIRDGVLPPRGSTNPVEQFDTFTDGSARQEDWIGYAFQEAQTIGGLRFQEGMEFPSGGWFSSLRAQVMVNGAWVDATGLRINPPYQGRNGTGFEVYDISFTKMNATGVRIIGEPGGNDRFVSVGELRVLTENPRPADYVLEQNYPNPFNPSTRIAYRLPGEAQVRLTVYNVLGEEVRSIVDEFQQAGAYSMEFDGRGLAAGVYMAVLRANDYVEVRKMVLLK